MTSSIIATNKDTYFYCYMLLSLFTFFSVLKALNELKLLVDIDWCHWKKYLNKAY